LLRRTISSLLKPALRVSQAWAEGGWPGLVAFAVATPSTGLCAENLTVREAHWQGCTPQWPSAWAGHPPFPECAVLGNGSPPVTCPLMRRGTRPSAPTNKIQASLTALSRGSAMGLKVQIPTDLLLVRYSVAFLKKKFQNSWKVQDQPNALDLW